MSSRFARASLALALVVPVVVVFSPTAAGATRPGSLAATSNGAYAAVDVTDPTVTLTTPPDGAVYPIGRTVVADFACADEAGGSGIATCVGTVEDGQAVDTAALGDHDFTFTATDVAGNTTEVTHTYTVVPDETEDDVTVTATDNAAHTTEVTHTYSVADARPDGRIRRGTGVLLGDDIYNTTGKNQTRTGTAPRGQSVTYYAPVQNDAAFAERLRLHGMPSTPAFTVRYYAPAGANITPQVTAGTSRTPVLAPQGTYRVKVIVNVLNSAPRNASVARTLTAISTTHPTIKDTVRFEVVCFALGGTRLPQWRGPVEGPWVAAVGDSLLHQLEHSGPTHPNSDVALTLSMIDEGWRSTVRGENGWIIQWVRGLSTEAAEQGAEGIIISAGTNDVSWVSLHSNQCQARRVVQAQIRKTLDAAASARCIVWPTLHQYGGQLTVRAINTTLRNQAERRGNLVVPEWGNVLSNHPELVAAGPEFVGGDGLHLSEAGEAAFQSLVLGTMRTCLGTG